MIDLPDDPNATQKPAPTTHVEPEWIHRVIEAEDLVIVSPMVISKNNRNASGNSCVKLPLLPKGDRTPTGTIAIPVNYTGPKTLKIWMRTKWNGTCSNSLTLRIPGLPVQTIGEDGTYNQWIWHSGPTFQMKSKDPIILQEREEDVAIDQIIITSDLEYIPQGIEDAE